MVLTCVKPALNASVETAVRINTGRFINPPAPHRMPRPSLCIVALLVLNRIDAFRKRRLAKSGRRRNSITALAVHLFPPSAEMGVVDDKNSAQFASSGKH